MSLLVIMGSGETAPTMVKAHRAVLARSDVPEAGPAVMLDTTFGFQMNAEDLVTKTRTYFAESVGVDVQLATWRTRELDPVEQERTLALLARSRWAFAGPGSPTYALAQWRDTAVPPALLDVAARGGTLVFGSAAACTVGSHTVPVYEIYKAGATPFWQDGLDVLGALTGIRAVVIPHFDNAEGGVYDTRFCYLGEPRLAALEAMLPDDVGVLGIDEHTAIVIDTDAGTVTVGGNGRMTIRRRGSVRTLVAGEQLSIESLDAALRGAADITTAPANSTNDSTDDSDVEADPDDGTDDGDDTGITADVPAEAPEPTSLAEHTDLSREAFEAALAARDVDGCVSAILDLDAAIVAWSTDSLQSDEASRARRTLRSMVFRLGDLARAGAGDPADVVRPFVELALDLRTQARTNRDFATGDLIRDRLLAAGLEIRDTPEGVTWSITETPDRSPTPSRTG
ncbi:MAG: hypothetical protein IPJ14_00785 [Kineosporiaceae bacterium]|nr:hypothetical protein [Kineosporiaceae bacterium]